MWLFPLSLDISWTNWGRRKYLGRVLSFLRPTSVDPLKEAKEDFHNFGRSLLISVREIIYSDLSIIDNKTNSLMQLNAILVVVYSIAYGNIIEGKLKPTQPEVEALILSIFLSLIAILLLMSCVFIRWETYKATGANLEEDLLWWIKLRDSRTWRYRLAWLANAASILIFVYLILKNYAAITSIGVRN
jgi:hypothetical protein